jgi:hypothetical protein
MFNVLSQEKTKKLDKLSNPSHQLMQNLMYNLFYTLSYHLEEMHCTLFKLRATTKNKVIFLKLQRVQFK